MDAFLHANDSGGFDFDAKAASADISQGQDLAGKITGAAQAWSGATGGQLLTASELDTVASSTAAAVTAIFPAAAPFAAAAVAIVAAGAALLDTGVTHAVTTYPSWQGTTVATWNRGYGLGAGWGWGNAVLGPPIVDPPAGSFESFYYAAIGVAMRQAAASGGNVLLGRPALVGLLATTLDGWNRAHVGAPSAVISRHFHNVQSTWGGGIHPDSVEPISMGMPWPDTDSTVSITIARPLPFNRNAVLSFATSSPSRGFNMAALSFGNQRVQRGGGLSFFGTPAAAPPRVVHLRRIIVPHPSTGQPVQPIVSHPFGGAPAGAVADPLS